MGVLCNLCALPGNGEAFIMGGGLSLLENIFDNPDSADNVRLAAASVLHNLAANQDTALLLSADEGIDLLVKILTVTPVDTVLFLNTLKVLAALLFKLPEDNKFGGNKKPAVMQRILQKGLGATLNEAVSVDDKELQEMTATLMVVIAQTSPKLSQQLADLDCPGNLIQPCMFDPTPQTLHCSFAVFFHVCDAFQNQARLVEKGLFDLLASEWYLRQDIREESIHIACGIFIKMLSNSRNAGIASQHEEGINKFIAWCRQNKPSNIKDLCTAIETAMKQLDPTMQEMHVQESYKEKKQEKPQEMPKEVKKIGRQSKVVQDDAVVPQVQKAAAVQSQGGTHDEVSEIPEKVADGDIVPYADIKSGKVQVPQEKKEAYLSDEEFEKVLGMDRPTFYQQRPWKQKQLKKSKGLF
jgi:hypothetical protein